ncbi:nicotinamidase-related amidase [Pseudoxanthomonas sp. 3HH-4]|uniref:cysteine hydrolase family protein n=1 Tax=Pseudoxanthomonas sp. 3HH-4 TaxID=1690214 RepID=UPI00114E243F|nr:isochorismatase family protein [Pseudoxanthomonas sp. 3HH-4]TQM06672.1 nicotinamidase-related amidase [Pseudoxanthomonas sp. 3HH-4]
MTTALLITDVQNNHFAKGGFPALDCQDHPRRHLPNPLTPRTRGPGPACRHPTDNRLFKWGTDNTGIDIRILAAAGAAVIVKHQADSFHQTKLSHLLAGLGATRFRIIGTTTQNCVVFSALSEEAESYWMNVLPDCCATPDESNDRFAIHALSSQVSVEPDRDLCPLSKRPRY